MSAAREEILARIARANARVADVAAVTPADPGYRRGGTLDEDERVRLFATRVEEYGARVVVAGDDGEAVARVLADEGAERVGVAHDLPVPLRPSSVTVIVDGGLAPEDLDGLDCVVTTCAGACATTGTFALDGGPGQGRRALTLVPDLHVCIVRRAQIVETVPELLAMLEPSARAGRPIVLVSGPSATSDIELARVEGVHGPRRLVVVVVS